MLIRTLRRFLTIAALIAGPTFAQTTPPAAIFGRTLYNGIVLPEVWPPCDGDVMSVEPMKVPYLQNPPKVIPIDVGRQLFVDDFLVEQTDLKRTFHAAEKYQGNPVLVSSTKEELQVREDSGSKNASGGTVALLHGGAFYDPADQFMKLWFSGGSSLRFEMARSRDGIRWERGPDKIAQPATVVPVNDCFWLDLEARDPAQRLKLQAVARAKPSEQHLHKVELNPLYHAFYTSANGAKWSDAVPAGNSSDYSSFFYNPFRQRWVYSIKASVPPRHRVRRYAESAEFGPANIFDSSVFWVGADKLDKPDPKVGDVPQLYSLGAVAYESLMLGMFFIHVGPHNTVCQKLKSPKHIDLKAGFSRDGFHWDRPFREPFIASTRTEGAWDKGYVHSPAGILFVVGDRLIFPYSGCSGTAPDGRKGMYAGQSIGLAMLRRDGFASMDGGAKPGVLTTRPITFKGEHLFVNLNAPGGELRVEALDESGRVSFTSEPVSGDSTKQLIKWKGASSLASLSGKPVRLRFHLANGQLYAFWVTPDANGASFGYLGGGGPGSTGVRDMPLPLAPSANAPAPLWIGHTDLSKNENIPFLEAEHRFIDECAAGEFQFTLGADIVFHDGEFIAQWANSRLEENDSESLVRARRSQDAVTWSGREIIAPGFDGPGYHSHGVFHSLPGQLWSFNAQHRQQQANNGYFQGLRTDAFLWKPDAKKWEPQAIDGLDGFWPLCQPVRLANGKWIMAGAKNAAKTVLAAVAICSDDRMTRWNQVIIPHPADLAPDQIWGETTVTVEGSRVLAIVRNGRKGGTGFWQSISTDHGETWPELSESNLPHGGGRPVLGRLTDGRHYLVSNIRSRNTLVLALTKPGTFEFDRMVRLLDKPSPPVRMPPAGAKRSQWGYPSAIEHEGKLYVVYSATKEATGLTVVDLSKTK